MSLSLSLSIFLVMSCLLITLNSLSLSLSLSLHLSLSIFFGHVKSSNHSAHYIRGARREGRSINRGAADIVHTAGIAMLL